MTKAERNAVNSYKKELIAQGIEKEIAEVMAKSLVETKVIIPVVNCQVIADLTPLTDAEMQEVKKRAAQWCAR